jgi:two-component system phosphate regulon sensor histidine kinase PhoR
MKSFLFRFFTRLLLILLVLFACVVVLSYRSTRVAFIHNYTEDLKRTNYTLVATLQNTIHQADYAQLQRTVKVYGASLGVRITVVDTSGKVLADSESEPNTMHSHLYRPEIQQALSGQIGRDIRFSATVERDLLYVATPVKFEGNIIAVLRTSLAMQAINALLLNLIRQISAIILIALLLMVGVLVFFINQVEKKIKRLIEATGQVAEGHFQTPIYFQEKDEFAQLAQNLNTMSEKLQQYIQNLQTEEQRLNKLLATMPAGLTVIAPDGGILFANAAFNALFDESLPTAHNYWEVIRLPQLIDMIQKTQTTKSDHSGEFEVGNQIYLVSATNISGTGETLLIFSDITPLKEMQRLKKEFIGNVSHELRTPLTAIKGFVETLLEEYPQVEKSYLTIVARHTERLINIVNDLLLLSELEETRQLAPERIDLRVMVAEVLKIFENELAAKNLTFKQNIAADAAWLTVDPFKFQQVLINLIDNACKYTNQGEITLTAERQGEQVLMDICDTGIGIPAEHLGRIFERFYVVDKSRSRRLGGTGLGLAITKHIVLLHGGRITVTSTPGKGTCFRIVLPLSSD